MIKGKRRLKRSKGKYKGNSKGDVKKDFFFKYIIINLLLVLNSPLSITLT